jgi:hypothetical protein
MMGASWYDDGIPRQKEFVSKAILIGPLSKKQELFSDNE